ncbi:MAG TPA: glycosyltransferase [Steroidobacter sp.]
MSRSIDIVFIGLAITSSWGNGHATTYRSLIKGLASRGHRILFLERDLPWYAQNRDAPRLDYCETQLYSDAKDLRARFGARVRAADAVIVGSYVKEGAEVCDWVLEEARGVRAFYDIDTPVTLSRLQNGTCEYLLADQIPQFDVVLSFAGGPMLGRLESELGARRARALYCSVDLEQYRPEPVPPDIELGYMGTYSEDRQAGLEALLKEPARRLSSRRFVVVGAQYPEHLLWPRNVERIEHLPPRDHPLFYSRQRYTLNLTRAQMRRAGFSPSVRLFEAAACGTPIISDDWPGLTELFSPREEILIVHDAGDVVACLEEISNTERERIARAALERVAEQHSGARRALELEGILEAAQREVASSCALDADAPSKASRSFATM